ncbi:alpha/beta fold hydrolase [Kitasatospora sp. NPDC097691]|uniref:alpha/beta fold hydrolase n=1 Tax=Kitasatospora sp. NPDC097691 TaxID=3157231 RepID=UPI003322A203
MSDRIGTDTTADVVARLRAHLGSALPPEALPARFVFVDTLPVLPNGKTDRAALERHAAGTAPAPSTPDADAPPGDEAPGDEAIDDETIGDEAIDDDLDFLLHLFVAELAQARIDPDEDLTQLGVTSLILTKACAAWTDRTGRRVDGLRLRRHPTVRNILAYSSPTGRGPEHEEVVVEDHRFDVPIDHDDPAGPSIELFAQTVVRREAVDRHLPYLLFLQGGPGGQCPDPRSRIPAWLDAVLDRYRVVLLDQRGGGRSSPVTAATIEGMTATAALERLRCYRADAIVRDAEFLRERVLRVPAWTLFGESYGGSIALTYLSYFPDGIDRVFVSSGLLGPVSTAEDLLTDTLAMSRKKNAEYYRRYPEDAELIDRIVDHLGEHEVVLPTGERLSPERFRFLGLKFGFANGMASVHDLVRSAWDGDDLAEDFVKAVAAATYLVSSPLFYLQEFTYGQPGRATGWTADRLYADEPAFRPRARPFHFYGEVFFPWMFRQFAALAPFADVADELARYTGWTSLYDLEQLERNTVPIYAVAAADDLYFPGTQQFRTAQRIGSCWLLLSADYSHEGLMNDREGVSRLLDFGSTR